MSSLPPGYRFYPTEGELVQFYLRNKLEKRKPDTERYIPVVDVYRHHPTELPPISGEASVKDPEQWFFFCPRQEKEAHGGRPTRITQSGYWKATGSPSQVIDNNRIIGRKKAMVFYEGRPPRGHKTSWKMHEYRAYEEASSSGGALKLRNEFSLCRVYKNSGSLRSFDRRPPVATARANAGDVLCSGPIAGTPSCHGNPTIEAAVAERELSQGSSPADEQVPAGEELDWGMLDDLDWVDMNKMLEVGIPDQFDVEYRC